jgi:hypothetical protein
VPDILWRNSNISPSTACSMTRHFSNTPIHHPCMTTDRSNNVACGNHFSHTLSILQKMTVLFPTINSVWQAPNWEPWKMTETFFTIWFR